MCENYFNRRLSTLDEARTSKSRPTEDMDYEYREKLKIAPRVMIKVRELSPPSSPTGCCGCWGGLMKKWCRKLKKQKQLQEHRLKEKTNEMQKWEMESELQHTDLPRDNKVKERQLYKDFRLQMKNLLEKNERQLAKEQKWKKQKEIKKVREEGLRQEVTELREQMAQRERVSKLETQLEVARGKLAMLEELEKRLDKDDRGTRKKALRRKTETWRHLDKEQKWKKHEEIKVQCEQYIKQKKNKPLKKREEFDDHIQRDKMQEEKLPAQKTDKQKTSYRQIEGRNEFRCDIYQPIQELWHEKGSTMWPVNSPEGIDGHQERPRIMEVEGEQERLGEHFKVELNPSAAVWNSKKGYSDSVTEHLQSTEHHRELEILRNKVRIEGLQKEVTDLREQMAQRERMSKLETQLEVERVKWAILEELEKRLDKDDGGARKSLRRMTETWRHLDKEQKWKKHVEIKVQCEQCIKQKKEEFDDHIQRDKMQEEKLPAQKTDKQKTSYRQIEERNELRCIINQPIKELWHERGSTTWQVNSPEGIDGHQERPRIMEVEGLRKEVTELREQMAQRERMSKLETQLEVERGKWAILEELEKRQRLEKDDGETRKAALRRKIETWGNAVEEAENHQAMYQLHDAEKEKLDELYSQLQAELGRAKEREMDMMKKMEEMFEKEKRALESDLLETQKYMEKTFEESRMKIEQQIERIKVLVINQTERERAMKNQRKEGKRGKEAKEKDKKC